MTRYQVKLAVLLGATAPLWGCATMDSTNGNGNGNGSTPTPTSMSVVSGGSQTATVATQLPADVVVQVNDQSSNPMSGQTVTFTATDGMAGTSSATTDASGQAQTAWTLGTVAGQQELIAAVSGTSVQATINATGTADVADSILAESGDGQFGFADTKLNNDIVAKVVDQYGNGVQGHTVAFSVNPGNGMLDSAQADTDANGESPMGWTLGSVLGPDSAEASAPGLKGDPVTFTATVTQISITSITPDTLAEGQSGTMLGTGFSPTIGDNAVTVGGVTATITSASMTQLDFTVPISDCQPQQDRTVGVSVFGVGPVAQSHPVKPASYASDLAVGQMSYIETPADFCFQFERSTTGGDEYIIGAGASAEVDATMGITVTAVTGAVPAPPVLARPLAQPAMARSAAASRSDPELMQQRLRHRRAENRIREWEREHLDPIKHLAYRAPAVAARGTGTAAVPAVGDTLHLHVPDVAGNLCDSIPIDAEVRVVGTNGVFVTDVNNPIADSLTLAEITAQSDTFDMHTGAVLASYFGTLTDIDSNGGRVLIILTVEVNKFGGIAGFVTNADFFSPATCGSSDLGEIFYGWVPDASTSKASVLGQMASLVAHEVTHVYQFSQRLSGVVLTRWEAEGMATLAEEVSGHSVLGNMAAQNYDFSVATSAGAGDQWYEPEFQQLAQYFGFISPAAKAAGAPEECTLFGLTSAMTTPCSGFHFYGSSWSFQRFVADQFGPTYTGGEAGLLTDWITQSTSLNGVANIEALLGVDFDSLFARWAAALYADDRDPAVDPTISMLSWDLFDIFETNWPAERRLAPFNRSFAAFMDSRTVRGGSTAYTRISAAGARSALALRVRDGSDMVLGTTLKPQIWIVRLN